MSDNPAARPGSGATSSGDSRSGTARPGWRRGALRRWAPAAGNAEAVLAEARKALFVMTAIVAVLWIVQIINWADGYRLSIDYGIRARQAGSLPDIFTAPFLHFSFAHIEGNSGPLFIFGFLAAYRGVARFAGVTVVVVLSSGLAAWFTDGPRTVGAGASGVVFGYFGYIMVRGLFDRHAIDVLIGAVMALCFAYQFSVLLPHAGIDWQAHVGGLAGGLLAGWLFRDRRPARGRPGEARPGAGGRDGPRAELHRQIDNLGL